MATGHYLSAPKGYSLGTADPSSLHYEQMRSTTIGNMTSDEIEKSLPEMNWAAEKAKFQRYQKHPDKNNPQALYGRLKGLDPDQAWNEVARRLWMRYYSNSPGGLYEGQIPEVELTGMTPIAAPEGSPGQGLMTGTGKISIGPPKATTPSVIEQKTSSGQPVVSEPQASATSGIPSNWMEQLSTKGYVGNTAPQSVAVEKKYIGATPYTTTPVSPAGNNITSGIANPTTNVSGTNLATTAPNTGTGAYSPDMSFLNPASGTAGTKRKTGANKYFNQQWFGGKQIA